MRERTLHDSSKTMAVVIVVVVVVVARSRRHRVVEVVTRSTLSVAIDLIRTFPVFMLLLLLLLFNNHRESRIIFLSAKRILCR